VVAGRHAIDHEGRDLVGWHAGTQILAEIPRPLPRAQAHHPVLRIRGPATTQLCDQLSAHLLPHRLRID